MLIGCVPFRISSFSRTSRCPKQFLSVQHLLHAFWEHANYYWMIVLENEKSVKLRKEIILSLYQNKTISMKTFTVHKE